MKLFGLLTLLSMLFNTQTFARVAQILPNGELARSPNTIVYTRVVEEPAFYEHPLFIGIAVFAALIIGLIIGLVVSRRKAD
jgi:ABC-type antimicrobial peptide transport system permease subunit